MSILTRPPHDHLTYLPKQGGGLYLATWIDRYLRKVVGLVSPRRHLGRA